MIMTPEFTIEVQRLRWENCWYWNHGFGRRQEMERSGCSDM